LAAEDKKRHAAEMEMYTPPPEFSGKRKRYVLYVLVGERAPLCQSKPSALSRGYCRAKKDPNAPKKPMSAYFLFAQAKRQAIKEANPGLSLGGVCAYFSVV
jgi:hypothetical protein